VDEIGFEVVNISATSIPSTTNHSSHRDRLPMLSGESDDMRLILDSHPAPSGSRQQKGRAILPGMPRGDAPKFDREKSMSGLCYEYYMLRSAAALLHHRFTGDPVLHSAVLESFFVHARNLHDFLGFHREKDRRDGDYWASDFVDGFQEEVFDKDTVQKINWWLHHLTTWRYDTPKKPEWPFISMLRDVVECMEAFLKEEPADQHLAEPLLQHHQAAKTFLKQSGFDSDDPSIEQPELMVNPSPTLDT